MTRSARPAAIEILLYVRLAQREPGRTAIDDAAHRDTVAFAECRHREQSTERIACHVRLPARKP
jgi:hypothetical protein